MLSVCIPRAVPISDQQLRRSSIPANSPSATPRYGGQRPGLGLRPEAKTLDISERHGTSLSARTSVQLTRSERSWTS